MGFLDNSAWFKILSDGKVEQGIDGDIILKKASWTRGRQDIVAASYIFDDYSQGFTIVCPPDEQGKFPKVEQYDDMIMSVMTNASTRTRRSFKIENVGYKRLYKFEDYFLNNKVLVDKDGKDFQTKMLCFQLTLGENSVGEEVLGEDKIKDCSSIFFAITDDGQFSIETE